MRRTFVPPIRKPDTVARSAARPLVAGDSGEPADSIGEPTMVGKHARFKTASTALGARSGSKRQEQKHRSLNRPRRRVQVDHRNARVSAQRQIRNFPGATVRGVKCTLRSPVAAPASDSAALLANRLCAESSSENGGGGSVPVKHEHPTWRAVLTAPEFVDAYFPGSHAAVSFHRPQKEEGAGRPSGPIAGLLLPFSDFPQWRQGDDSACRRSGVSCTVG